MKITQNMIDDFNSVLNGLGCCFRLSLCKANTEDNAACNIIVANSLFIDSYIFNLTDDFYQALENYFDKYEIKLSYNNTKSCFWSKNGWEN